MWKSIGLVIFLKIFFAGMLFGQTPPELEEILKKSQEQSAFYQETFRNLLALETKTFEEFGNNSELKKQNKVEADFLVYQSSKNPKISFELRNVLRVDGKPIPNNQNNSEAFFAELGKTSTLKSELEKIQKNSSKYDKTFDISGLTLYEGIVLSDNLRSAFAFNLEGRETFQDCEVYLISYRQITSSPFISINAKGVDHNNPSLEFNLDIPGDLNKNEIFLRGKIWVDAQTAQIWREERELVAQGSEPLVVMESSFEYQPSKYEILVPKQIILTINKIKKKDGRFVAIKDTRIFFDYSEFKRTETDVKILDDTES